LSSVADADADAVALASARHTLAPSFLRSGNKVLNDGVRGLAVRWSAELRNGAPEDSRDVELRRTELKKQAVGPLSLRVTDAVFLC